MDSKHKELVAEGIEIAGKTALSLIPIGGTFISCVWDSVKAHAAQKRLDAWTDIVEQRLSKLEQTLDVLMDCMLSKYHNFCSPLNRKELPVLSICAH